MLFEFLKRGGGAEFGDRGIKWYKMGTLFEILNFAFCADMGMDQVSREIVRLQQNLLLYYILGSRQIVGYTYNQRSRFVRSPNDDIEEIERERKGAKRDRERT